MQIVGVCEVCGIAITAEQSEFAWFQTQLWQQGRKGRVTFSGAKRTGKARCSACGPAGNRVSKRQGHLFE